MIMLTCNTISVRPSLKLDVLTAPTQPTRPGYCPQTRSLREADPIVEQSHLPCSAFQFAASKANTQGSKRGGVKPVCQFATAVVSNELAPTLQMQTIEQARRRAGPKVGLKVCWRVVRLGQGLSMLQQLQAAPQVSFVKPGCASSSASALAASEPPEGLQIYYKLA